MANIAIITARGGSKRIPKKNIKEFCGKPIIAYSIEAAINSKSFDEVMVSTDSEEIAEIAKKYGAKVPFLRSEKTSDDFATTVDVIEEVLQEYKKIGREFENFCCLYPTAPFITSSRLSEAMKMLVENKSQALLSVVKYSFPPQRSFIIREGRVEYIYPQYEKARSQDLEPVYHDAGQFYVCNSGDFLKYKSLIMPETIPFILEEEEVQDIDTHSDWLIAEMKYKLLAEKNK